MVTVEIEYWVPCGLLEPSIETQRKLLEEFGRDIDGVRLTTGHGGVFKVYADEDLVYKKSQHRNEIQLDSIVEAVDDRIGAEA